MFKVLFAEYLGRICNEKIKNMTFDIKFFFQHSSSKIFFYRNIKKGTESFPQTQIFFFLNLWNLMVYNFDISSLDYLIEHNS